VGWGAGLGPRAWFPSSSDCSPGPASLPSRCGFSVRSHSRGRRAKGGIQPPAPAPPPPPVLLTSPPPPPRRRPARRAAGAAALPLAAGEGRHRGLRDAPHLQHGRRPRGRRGPLAGRRRDGGRPRALPPRPSGGGLRRELRVMAATGPGPRAAAAAAPTALAPASWSCRGAAASAAPPAPAGIMGPAPAGVAAGAWGPFRGRACSRIVPCASRMPARRAGLPPVYLACRLPPPV
jgi:hypothetical protein